MKAPFMVQYGRWHRMQMKLVEISNGGQDLFDETGEAKMDHDADTRAFASRD